MLFNQLCVILMNKLSIYAFPRWKWRWDLDQSKASAQYFKIR